MHSTNKSVISNSSSYQNDNIWVNSEYYFYGKITGFDRNEHPHILFKTEDQGILKIKIPKDKLAEISDEYSDRNYGVRVKAKQNIRSGEFDINSLKFIELKEYSNTYDDEYINTLRKKAHPWLNGIETEKWLREVRG